MSCGREHSFASDEGWLPSVAVPPYRRVKAELYPSPVALVNTTVAGDRFIPVLSPGGVKH